MNDQILLLFDHSYGIHAYLGHSVKRYNFTLILAIVLFIVYNTVLILFF